MIYTKTGDKGTTSLVGGTRVHKYDMRVECYGTLDELNSNIGLLRALMLQSDILSEISQELLIVLNIIFDAQAIVACEDKQVMESLRKISDDDIEMLEKRIDLLSEELPKIKYFILPTGSVLSSTTHVARTICRRSERLLWNMNDNVEKIDSNLLKFVNRLSDYLFILSRKILKEENIVQEYWKPRG